jgi:hypothetical protein
MVMRNRWLVAGAIVLGMVVTAVYAGAAARGSVVVRWEYGVFRGEGTWSWYGPQGEVDRVSSQDFAKTMGAGYSTDDAALEANVLNALGEQGWELVTASERNKYILRRPR